jgi:hypothetical protein
MQEQITQLHLEILALCFAVKAKGHDAFYLYSPHVDWATVNVYVDGWSDKKEYIRLEYLWTRIEDGGDIEPVLQNLVECKTYLEGLIG